MGGDWSAAQMGQHSPNGISGLGQSFSSSQTISSHRTDPVSHTQMRQGSGFHTSLSLWRCPSCMQLKTSSSVCGVKVLDTQRKIVGVKKMVRNQLREPVIRYYSIFF